MSARARSFATARDLLRLPDDVGREIVRGSIVEKAAPTAEHASQGDRRVRAEPFDAVEIDVGLPFGEDPEQADGRRVAHRWHTLGQ
jgi:hypothetical protein